MGTSQNVPKRGSIFGKKDKRPPEPMKQTYGYVFMSATGENSHLLINGEAGEGATSCAQLVEDLKETGPEKRLIRKSHKTRLRLAHETAKLVKDKKMWIAELPPEILNVQILESLENKHGLPTNFIKLRHYEILCSGKKEDKSGRRGYYLVSYWSLYNGGTVRDEWLPSSDKRRAARHPPDPVPMCFVFRMVWQILGSLYFMWTAGHKPLWHRNFDCSNFFIHWPRTESSANVKPEFYVGSFRKSRFSRGLDSKHEKANMSAVEDLKPFMVGLGDLLLHLKGKSLCDFDPRDHRSPPPKAKRLDDRLGVAMVNLYAMIKQTYQSAIKNGDPAPPDLTKIIERAKVLEQEAYMYEPYDAGFCDRAIAKARKHYTQEPHTVTTASKREARELRNRNNTAEKLNVGGPFHLVRENVDVETGHSTWVMAEPEGVPPTWSYDHSEDVSGPEPLRVQHASHNSPFSCVVHHPDGTESDSDYEDSGLDVKAKPKQGIVGSFLGAFGVSRTNSRSGSRAESRSGSRLESQALRPMSSYEKIVAENKKKESQRLQRMGASSVSNALSKVESSRDSASRLDSGVATRVNTRPVSEPRPKPTRNSRLPPEAEARRESGPTSGQAVAPRQRIRNERPQLPRVKRVNLLSTVPEVPSASEASSPANDGLRVEVPSLSRQAQRPVTEGQGERRPRPRGGLFAQTEQGTFLPVTGPELRPESEASVEDRWAVARESERFGSRPTPEGPEVAREPKSQRQAKSSSQGGPSSRAASSSQRVASRYSQPIRTESEPRPTLERNSHLARTQNGTDSRSVQTRPTTLPAAPTRSSQYDFHDERLARELCRIDDLRRRQLWADGRMAEREAERQRDKEARKKREEESRKKREAEALKKEAEKENQKKLDEEAQRKLDDEAKKKLEGEEFCKRMNVQIWEPESDSEEQEPRQLERCPRIKSTTSPRQQHPRPGVRRKGYFKGREEAQERAQEWAARKVLKRDTTAKNLKPMNWVSTSGGPGADYYDYDYDMDDGFKEDCSNP